MATEVDFASLATKIVKADASQTDTILKAASAPTDEVVNEPVRKEPAKEAPVKEAVKEPAKETRKIPDELFGGKKDKPTEKPPAEEESEIAKIERPDFKDPKRREQWDTLHAKASTFEKEARANAAKAAELEAKVKDFETRGKDTDGLQAKLATLEKEHAEALALVRKVNIDLDPAYNKKFVEGRKSIIASARAIVEESGGDPAAVEVALNLKGKPRVDALREVATDMDGFQQGRLGRVIDELTALDNEASTLRSNPEEFMAQRQKEQQDAQQREAESFHRNANLAFDQVLDRLRKESPVLQKVEGLEWWNKQGDEIPARARANFNKQLPADEAAAIYLRAEERDVYRDLFLAEREEHASDKKALAERDAELKKLYGTTPRVEGQSSGAKSGAPRDFATVATDIMQGR